MAKNDKFKDDVLKTEKLYKNLSEQFKERSQLASNGQPTAKYDYLLRSGLDNLKQDLVTFEKLQYSYEREGYKFPDLTQKEKDKRVNQITELRAKCETLRDEIKLTFDGEARAIKDQQNAQYDDQKS